jgi:hypothetical protein
MKTKSKKSQIVWGLLLVILGVVLACIWLFGLAPSTQSWPKHTAAIAKLAQHYGIKGQPRQHWMVFVSVGGCGACLGQLIKFIDAHKDDTSYIFIVPSQSRKDFSLDIPPGIRFQKNVFRDSMEISFRDSLLQPTENTAYRLIDDVIVEKVVLTPDNIAEKLLYLTSTGQP